MSWIYVYVDIDGFGGVAVKNGPQVLVPREVGLCSQLILIDDPMTPIQEHLESVYFVGGLDEPFIAYNRMTLRYHQSVNIHGFPLNTLKTPPGALVLSLSSRATEAAQEAEEIMIVRVVAMVDRLLQLARFGTFLLPRLCFITRGGKDDY